MKTGNRGLQEVKEKREWEFISEEKYAKDTKRRDLGRQKMKN